MLKWLRCHMRSCRMERTKTAMIFRAESTHIFVQISGLDSCNIFYSQLLWGFIQVSEQKRFVLGGAV